MTWNNKEVEVISNDGTLAVIKTEDGICCVQAAELKEEPKKKKKNA